MLSQHWPIIIILVAAIIFTVVGRKLTVVASLVAGVVGTLVYIGAGYTGIAMVASFFTLGTGATSWKLGVKQQLGVAEENKGTRTAGQVIANAGVAGILGILIWLDPLHAEVYKVMMAGSISSATADTLSSELGNVYGSRFYNITTLKKDKRGLDGVVSIEGTLIGILGSVVIALIYSIGFGVSIAFLLIVLAGTIGNLADSLLGATVERKYYLNNNAVNFLNTAVGAVVALLLAIF